MKLLYAEDERAGSVAEAEAGGLPDTHHAVDR